MDSMQARARNSAAAYCGVCVCVCVCVCLAGGVGVWLRWDKVVCGISMQVDLMHCI